MIILMRSGRSENYDAEPRDHQRKLTEVGREDVRAAAAFLRQMGISLSAILTSPFQRARETGEEVSRNIPQHPEVIIAPLIMPGAGPEEIMRALANRTSCSSDDWVLAVCHEPDITNTIREVLDPQHNYRLPVRPADIFGLRINCQGGVVRGKLLFSFSPMDSEIK